MGSEMCIRDRNRTVNPVEFFPASTVSSDGSIAIRRRAKRKRARIFESSDIGNVDNCLVNDNNGDTASSENGETVDIIIGDVNSDSSNVNNCNNDKNIVVEIASSSHGNNSNIISNIDCSTILVDNVPSNANDKTDKVNDNGNNGSITWDDVVAMEDAARELEVRGPGARVPSSN